MRLLRKVRFSMGTIMMFVLTSAAAMALFLKVYQYAEPLPPGWKVDVPSLFLLAIALTSVALGSWKEHSAAQVMLQVSLACFGCLTLIWIGEAQYERAIRYWCQAAFALSVTAPMLARRFVKAALPRGPRRDWWKKTCEAVFFSFLTMMLVSVGGLFQFGVYQFASAFPAMGASAGSATPLPPTAPPVPPTPPPVPPGGAGAPAAPSQPASPDDALPPSGPEDNPKPSGVRALPM